VENINYSSFIYK